MFMHIVNLRSFTFQVVTAQVSDTGRYVCVANNVAGSAEKVFNLNVHGESQVDVQYQSFDLLCEK